MSFFEFPHTRTYDSDLGWLIKQVKTLMDCCESMNDWKIQHEAEYEQLKALYDDLMAGHFPDSIKTAFYNWMSANAQSIIGEMIKSVFFEISPQGYFIAWIPDGWDDIIFNTTYYDIYLAAHPEVEYGHLVLSY